jgi:hypothetical protein
LGFLDFSHLNAEDMNSAALSSRQGASGLLFLGHRQRLGQSRRGNINFVCEPVAGYLEAVKIALVLVFGASIKTDGSPQQVTHHRMIGSRRTGVMLMIEHRNRILKLDRLRLRGPCGARDQFLLKPKPDHCRDEIRACRAVAAEPDIADRLRPQGPWRQIPAPKFWSVGLEYPRG